MHQNRLWYPLCFFSFSLFLILIILPLSRQGMFLDGVIYAAIAKNLAIGHGSLWQPFYSQTNFSVFYEHPPLAIYFQSLLFKLFGQGFGVEQVYCLIIALGQFALIAWYWLKKENTAFVQLALLLLIWLLIPLNMKYVNNHLEATLTLFTTLASLVLLLKAQSKVEFFLQYLISSVAVLIAFFCNGPTAFFPLAVPLIRALVNKQTSWYDSIKETIFFALMLAILFCLVYYLVPAALLNTQHYLAEQLLPSTIGSRQLNLVGFDHLYIFNLYFRAYWSVSIVVLGYIAVAAKIKGQRIYFLVLSSLKNNNFLLFFLLSLLSSLPVGVSHRQALNYIMQSAPFFTLAMMYLCFEPVKTIINYFATKPRLLTASLYLNFLFFITTLVTVFCLANGYNAHKEIITDIKTIIPYCKNDEIISASGAIYHDYHAAAYFARHSMISLASENGNQYYLALKGEALPENYHLVSLPLSYYNLAIRDKL